MSASHHADSTHYRDVAEAAWRWVLGQVRHGPRIPESVPGPELEPRYANGFHMGIGGLAYVLAEIRHSRDWTAEEKDLANGIAERLSKAIPNQTDYSFFNGLVSTIGVLTVLDAPGTTEAVGRIVALATPTGWPQDHYAPRLNDLTIGTAGVLLGAIWAHRNGIPAARSLAAQAIDVLLAEREPDGNWLFVPRRFHDRAFREMPNFSHGLAGIATAVTLAGIEFDRSDLVEQATHSAGHLISLGRTDGDGFAVPRYIPHGDTDADEFTHNWCHGGAGTSLLFAALDLAGVASVAGAPPNEWRRRCLHTVRTSGLPARRYPGFWDNDGRCCGTAGVADIFLDSWQRTGFADDLDFALLLADTLVERAVVSGPHAYWRFIEHRAAEPLLPPGVSWSHGAAGIAAFLFRASRVAAEGRDAAVVRRMDSWWAGAAGGPVTSGCR